MYYLLLVLMALTVGAVMPAQAGINATLRTHLGDPVLAALVSFGVGTVALIGWVLALRVPWPVASNMAAAPWWAWSGGFMGAFIVAGSVVLAPKLGATRMLALIVLGQMLASLALDHFGVLGFRADPVTLRRALGAALLVAGTWLIIKP